VSTGSDDVCVVEGSVDGVVEVDAVSLVLELGGGLGVVGGVGGVTGFVALGVTGGIAGGCVLGVTGVTGVTGAVGVTGGSVDAGDVTVLALVVPGVGVAPSLPASPQATAQAKVGKKTTDSKR
jgi:hypothetical protein